MKRLCLRLSVLALFALTIVGLGPNVAYAGVNDFSFSSFDADYYLSKDSEGRSTMRVVERLTAEFDNIDQNKGIIRAIPRYYDGHSVSFHLDSLTRNGQTEPIYSQVQESNFVVISTGTDDYVNNTQQYVFTYTLRDVTKTFGDHQELYWDTNGTGWSQRFDKLNVRVHLDKSVADAFTGDFSCYEGSEGSNNLCQGRVDGDVVSLASNGVLSAGENLTFDLSFRSDTFKSYVLSGNEIMPYVLIAAALLLFIAAVFVKIRFGRNDRGRGIIVPEYLPPKDTSVLSAAEIYGKTVTAFPAQILDLAVRHKLKIIESETKMLFMKYKSYTLEIVSTEGLNRDEMAMLTILFPVLQPGSTYQLDRTDSSKAQLINLLIKTVKRESVESGYRLNQPKRVALQTFIIVAMFALLVVSFYMFLNSPSDVYLLISLPLGLVVTIAVIAFKLYDMKPLTPAGREVYDYLKGLEMYIKLAEADRLKYLQSPEGAEKDPIDTSDGAKMVVLYERVLPYAVLFGQEKEWLKQIGNYYESTQTSPGWYSGVGVFNAAAFVSSVGSFSSYANSSSSSSTSGSGGGGFSGGGGGGGGGGGR